MPIQTPTGTSSVSDINAARANAVANGVNPYQGAGATNVSTGAGLAITPESLTSTTPVVVPMTTNTPVVSGAAVQGTSKVLNDGIQTLINNNQPEINNTTTEVNTAKTGLAALIDKLTGKAQAQTDLETAGNIPGLTTSLNDITNEYNTKKEAFDHQTQAILNGSGSKEQVQSQIDELSRVHNSELADIAIRQSVATNNLKVAQDLINHKIDVQYGDLKDLISYQEQYLNNEQNQLSDAEKTKLSLQLEQNKRDYDTQTTQAKDLNDQIVKVLTNMQANGAPQSEQAKVQKATTPEEAIRLAGSYGVSPTDKKLLFGTTQERQDNAVSRYSSVFTPGHKLPNGTSIIQDNGYIDPTAWKSAIQDAPKEGINRQEFIKQFGYLLDSTDYSVYGITPAEEKLITGILPTS